MINGDHNNLFVGANDKLYWPNTENNLKGFRAYFQVPTAGPAAVPKNTPSRIVTRKETPTGVESIQSSAVSVQKIEMLIINAFFRILPVGSVVVEPSAP